MAEGRNEHFSSNSSGGSSRSSSVGDLRDLDREIKKLMQSRIESEMPNGGRSLFDHKLERKKQGKSGKVSAVK